MSAKALNLNLLLPSEMKSAAPVRVKVMLPIAAGLVGGFVLLWGTFVGVQYLVLRGRIAAVQSEISSYNQQIAENEAQMQKFRDLQAEASQFAYYLNGRNRLGPLFEEMADAIPEGITLMRLEVPPQPPQELRLPTAMQTVALQGPTGGTERVELRLVGVARSENDVFEMMENLKRESLTGLVSVVERPRPGERESPRVLAFRQESGAGDRRDVFFDLVYDLKPREFRK